MGCPQKMPGKYVRKTYGKLQLENLTRLILFYLLMNFEFHQETD